MNRISSILRNPALTSLGCWLDFQLSGGEGKFSQKIGRKEESVMKRIVPITIALLLVLAAAPFTFGSGDKGSGMKEGVDMEAAKATFEEYCAKCHGLDRPLGKQKDKDGWEATVSRMSDYHKRFGGPIPEDAEDAIVEYLVKAAGK